MSITMIAAVGKNNELGVNDDLIWRFKEDLQFFKNETMGKPMVMGYKTFYSLRGGKPLPGRLHIVLTSRDLEDNEQIKVVRSIDELLEVIKEYEEVMVIGGASVYKAMLEYADKLLLTEIDDSKDADVYFPEFDKNLYDFTVLSENCEDGIKYRRLQYVRKG